MNYHITDSMTLYYALESQVISDNIIDHTNTAKYVFRHSEEPVQEGGHDVLGWHFHNCYELLYFLRGDADYQIEQSRYTLHPHNLLIIKPGEYHSMFVKSSKRLDRIVIHFNDADLTPWNREILHSLSNVYSIPGTRLSEEILLVDKYQQDLANGIPKDILINQLQIILSFLCNIEDMRQTADQVDNAVEQIISYIHNHLSSIHTLDDICQNVHMSRSTVQNLISEYLQTPVMTYVRNQKCIQARSLLRQGCPATEVANRCGFADYSSFYRAYKKVFGTSPSNIGADVQTNSI